MIENKETSNLIILPTMGAQGSRLNCTKSTKQHVYTPNQLRSNGQQYKKCKQTEYTTITIRDLHLNKKNIGRTNKGIHLSKLELTTKHNRSQL